MSEFEALGLGVVQGLTEFLPVSSSGHLVMLQTLLGIHEKGVLFEVTVHVATLASVLIFYRKRVGGLIAGALRRDSKAMGYLGKLVLATLPAVLLVIVAGDLVEAQFESPRVVGICLLGTGAILWRTRRIVTADSVREPSWGAALLIGCAQALAILPGISRSGATVATALLLGVEPLAAAEFSFLMSVIAITAAAVRVAPDLALVATESAHVYAFSGAAALVSGVAAIWIFVWMMRRRMLYRYAYYTWTVGALFLLYLELAS